MANTYINLTGQATPSGNIPFALYTPINALVKKQPLIIHLHGAGEGSPTVSSGRANGGQHNATTVQIVDNSGVGLLSMTAAATLPQFTNPRTGEQFDFYMMAPQMYYPDGTSYSFGTPWLKNYVQACINYAKANLNIDPNRIYIVGLSLGGGGGITCLMESDIASQVAGAWLHCCGYGNSTTYQTGTINLAKYGIPITMVHAFNDPAASYTVSEIISRRVNLARPIRSIRLLILATGGHVIWNTFYTIGRPTITLNGGIVFTLPHNMFEWLLQYEKRGVYLPFYPA